MDQTKNTENGFNTVEEALEDLRQGKLILVTDDPCLLYTSIINGNDPFLYGEKVKAYLIRGARHLPGYDIWPNERVGYGSLCCLLYTSIRVLITAEGIILCRS